MPVSGTIGQTTFETRRVIDAAFRRCRLPPQAITSEMIENAKDQLWLMLSAMQAQFLPLWAQDRVVLGLTEGEAALDTPVGTIELATDPALRTLMRKTGTDTTASASVTTDLGAATIITSVGFKLSASGTFVLVIESSTDNVSWTARKAYASAAYTAGEWTWADLDPTIEARYWRIRETGGTAISVEEFYLGNTPTEIILGRTSLDTYQAIPDKTFRGRPTQVWLDRRYDRPRIMLWPTPDATNAFSQVVAYRQRHIMDVGSMSQTLEIPNRWFEAIVAGLAYRMAEDTPSVDLNLLAPLKARADETMAIMGADEKDNSPIRLRMPRGYR